MRSLSILLPWKAKLKMNLFAQRKPAAFTLIEMIVVILIIATLAAMIMTGASSLIDRARKVQAKNDVTQIVNSVNAYYTEYGKYPMVDANQGTDTLYGKSGTAPGNEDLCNVLRALAQGVNLGDVLNPRKIVFLSGRDSSRARSGFATAAITDSQGQLINVGASWIPLVTRTWLPSMVATTELRSMPCLTPTFRTQRATLSALVASPNRLVRMANRAKTVIKLIAALTTFSPGNR